MSRRSIGLSFRLGLVLAGGGVLACLLSSAAARSKAEPEPPSPAAKPPDAAAPVSASSRITNVTVYSDSALVTREVDVPAGPGSSELVVTPLPPQTVPNSLYSEGSDAVRVLATRFRSRAVRENTREEVRKVDEELKKLRLNQQKLQAELRAGDQNLNLLGKLENFTSAGTQGAERGKLDSDAVIALAKYVMDGRGEKTRELTASQQQLRASLDQEEFLQRKLKELTAGSVKTEHDAVIVVDRAEAAAGKVKLNYLVAAAAWRPQYKLRAGKAAKDPVQVEYLAAIVQQSGEDWRDVNIVLSTAQPMLRASPPDLKTLSVALVARSEAEVAADGRPGVPNPPGQQVGALGALGAVGVQLGALGAVGGGGIGGVGNQLGVQIGGFGIAGVGSGGGMTGGIAGGGVNPVPNPSGLATAKEINDLSRQLRQQAQQEVNQRKEAGADEIWNYAGTLEQAGDLALTEDVEKPAGMADRARPSSREGVSVTYHLSAKLSLPSRNDEQVVEVARIEMAPEYFYKAVPVLTTHVYRQATLTNKSRYVLLPGEATMYNGGDFVGRMSLPLVAVGEQFTVGFGTDPQLQVQRQMIDKTRSAQGGNQVLKYEYRILANSYKGERVRLQVWDRLPRGENETLVVSLLKVVPELSKDPIYQRESRPHNLLRWDLDLEPEANGEKAQEIHYEFKLELDKQQTFGSFRSK
jgi:hypothetical protein